MQKKRREIDANVLVVQKEPGETMGQLVERVRSRLNVAQGTKITFAGRLDPLAEGLVLLLKDEKRFEKDDFTALPKTYTFDLVFDVMTDTRDVLGKVTETKRNQVKQTPEETKRQVQNVLPTLVGTQKQSYPHYSSKTVKGVPLFHYARNKISVDVPINNIEIFTLELIGVREIHRNDFITTIEKKINTVQGDFRQEEIFSLWNKKSHKLPERLQVAHLVVECSSGTYVRVLAEKIASKIGRLGIADNINRIGIGEFTNEQIIV